MENIDRKTQEEQQTENDHEKTSQQKEQQCQQQTALKLFLFEGIFSTFLQIVSDASQSQLVVFPACTCNGINTKQQQIAHKCGFLAV